MAKKSRKSSSKKSARSSKSRSSKSAKSAKSQSKRRGGCCRKKKAAEQQNSANKKNSVGAPKSITRPTSVDRSRPRDRKQLDQLRRNIATSSQPHTPATVTASDERLSTSALVATNTDSSNKQIVTTPSKQELDENEIGKKVLKPKRKERKEAMDKTGDDHARTHTATNPDEPNDKPAEPLVLEDLSIRTFEKDGRLNRKFSYQISHPLPKAPSKKKEPPAKTALENTPNHGQTPDESYVVVTHSSTSVHFKVPHEKQHKSEKSHNPVKSASKRLVKTCKKAPVESKAATSCCSKQCCRCPQQQFESKSATPCCSKQCCRCPQQQSAPAPSANTEQAIRRIYESIRKLMEMEAKH